jgi:hypothetical protein
MDGPVVLADFSSLLARPIVETANRKQKSRKPLRKPRAAGQIIETDRFGSNTSLTRGLGIAGRQVVAQNADFTPTDANSILVGTKRTGLPDKRREPSAEFLNPPIWRNLAHETL